MTASHEESRLSPGLNASTNTSEDNDRRNIYTISRSKGNSNRLRVNSNAAVFWEVLRSLGQGTPSLAEVRKSGGQGRLRPGSRLRLRLRPAALVAGELEDVVDMMGFTPDRQLCPGEAQISAEDDLDPRPACSGLATTRSTSSTAPAEASMLERLSFVASSCSPQNMYNGR